MVTVFMPRFEMAVGFITGSLGHGPNSVVQIAEKDFSGNTEGNRSWRNLAAHI